MEDDNKAGEWSDKAEPTIQIRALSTREAARYCGISEFTLQKARQQGARKNRIDAPPHVELTPRKIVYLRDDLDHWLESKRNSAI